jgi:hypothetical protein
VLRFVGNVDFDEVRGDLADANWAWVLVAFVVAQLPRLTQALSAKGSVAADLRFGPLYVLQLATSYLNLALPSGLARMAVFIRFFQRQGLLGAAAVTAGAIDSFAGNVLQVVLVLTLALLTSADVLPELTAPGGDSRTLPGSSSVSRWQPFSSARSSPASGARSSTACACGGRR